ncbi:hypothetical protein C0J52_15625 [Blattella germanica]|nr:hypothetical protein C0J52_15625 [Blattella germanica]
MFLLLLIPFLLFIILLFIIDSDLELAIAERFGKPVERLAGKVVWITGASSGIGEHLARTLAQVGAKLVISARRESELERVKKNCLEIGNGLSDSDILVLPMDVMKVEQHKALFEKVLDHFGKLDVLVNNAGRSQRAHWENIDLSVDKEMFDLNVFGVVSLTRTVLPYFLEKNAGHIVVTSSIAGLMGVPYSASYTGAKHAIHGYFNALRTEKALTNIKVTLLCPGPVFSNFLAESFTDKPGEKFGKPVGKADRRMTGERCGRLCAVAIANELNESWIALTPLVPLLYLTLYYPRVNAFVVRKLGPGFFMKLRDTKTQFDTKTE